MTQVLYASLAGPNTTSDLYTVDPVTAVMTSVGPIGLACSGLAVDPTTGFLYGSTSNNSASHPAALISIDTSTGAGTLIGDFAQGAFHDAHDIAFDATGQLWGFDSSGGNLWQIDKATGVVTVIGGGSRGTEGALDFDSGGTLWWVGRSGAGANVGTLDTSTGAYTQVSTMSDSNPYHSGKFDAGGTFWASGPGRSVGGPPNLVTIDPSTGVVTPVAAFSVPGVGGLAWAGSPSIQADFTASPTHGSAPLSVNFTDTSTPGPSGPITGWAWTFGDGGTDTAQNPNHVYLTGGHFTVTLTVTGTAPDGTSTKTRTAYIVVFGPDVLYAALAGPATTSHLYTVDAGSGVMTSVGDMGVAVSGLAQDPTDGTLYGVTSANSSSNHRKLISINVNTAAVTFIGSILPSPVHDIAFDDSGQLWAVNGSGVLWKIGKTTGVRTVIGGGGTTYSGGLDFDNGGTLYKVGYNPDNIGTVDTATGAVTFLEHTSDANPLHSGKFDALDLFWASSPGQDGTAGLNLVTVDVGAGTVTVIAPFSVPSVGGLAWVGTLPALPDFTPSLVPSSINVSPGVHTLVMLNTSVFDGDTESITLSYTGAAGITLSFDTNPITAGDSTVVHVTIPGVISPGVYTIPIHCVGTDNSHDVTLTVHVFSSGTAPGTHIAS